MPLPVPPQNCYRPIDLVGVTSVACGRQYTCAGPRGKAATLTAGAQTASLELALALILQARPTCQCASGYRGSSKISADPPTCARTRDGRTYYCWAYEGAQGIGYEPTEVTDWP